MLLKKIKIKVCVDQIYTHLKKYINSFEMVWWILTEKKTVICEHPPNKKNTKKNHKIEKNFRDEK